LNRTLDKPEDEMRLRGIFAQRWKEFHEELKVAADMGIPQPIMNLLTQLRDLEEKFWRCWDTDLNADSWEPIKLLVKQTKERLERLKNGVDQRAQFHVYELKSKLGNILSGSKDAVRERKESAVEYFAKANAAIRAEFETMQKTQ